MEIRTFRASPSLVSSGVLTRRGNLNTDGHKGRACEDSGSRQSLTAEGGDLSDPSREALRRNLSCRHLDLRLPAARAVRKCIPAVQAAECVVPCCGSLSRASAIFLSLWKAWGILTHGTWQGALMKCKRGGVLGGGGGRCFYFSELQEGLAEQNEDSEVRWWQNCGQVSCFGGKNLRGGALCALEC